MQLLGDDRRIHLLRKTGNQYRSVTSQAGWASYNGETSGSRYSPLTQISKSNVGRIGAEVDLQPAQHVAAAGDAGRGRRRDVCDERQRVLRARRRQRSRDLALPASADQGPGRQRRRRREPRRRRRRRSRVHGHRSRAPHRAQPPHGRAPLGNRDGGLAPELQRDRRAAAGRQPRRHRHVRRRRRRARLRGRVRSVDRQRGVALLDGSAAGRAGIGDVAGQGHRASGRDDVDDGRVRSAARYDLLAGRQPGTRSDRRRSRRRQSLYRFDRGARCEDRRAEVALPVHAARRLGLRRAGDAGAGGRDLAGASRASSWCRPTATDSSTCSIAPTASSSSARST